jgi:methylated-DNA-[protein]-cysteine S-methyltransferase
LETEHNSTYVRTPIGPVRVTVYDGRIVRILLPPVDGDPDSDAGAGADVDLFDDVAIQLNEYLDGRRRSFDLPTDVHGTNFQMNVWSALAEIPYGETVTYRDLADTIGHPDAQRAVGSALHANPLPILLPCHRVVSSRRGAGGYAGGLALKRSLLDLERR